MMKYLVILLLLAVQAIAYVGHPGSDIAGGNPIFSTCTITDMLGIGHYPESKLDVDGVIRAMGLCDETGNNCVDISKGWSNLSTAYYLDASDGLPRKAVYVDADGKVGIGTTQPMAALDIQGDIRISGLKNCDTIDTDEQGDLVCGVDDGSDEDWTIDGQTISRSGDVAIGTSTPAAKLHVDGSVRFEDFQDCTLATDADGDISCTEQGSLWNSTGNNVYTTGGVMIGTDQLSGDLNLDVEGKIGASEYCDEDGNNCVNTTATIDLQIVTEMCTTKICRVQCPEGYVLTGGGCDGYYPITSSYPAQPDEWLCVTQVYYNNFKAYAICMKW